MVAVVARPPIELTKKNFLTKKLLFYVAKPIQRNELSKVLYKLQQLKSFEEASGLFLSINWEKWSEKRDKL